MRDDYDIEDVLRSHSSGPSARVKRTVLTAFKDNFKSKGYRYSTVGFWRKPIPLYIVAASLVVLMGISYFAGKRAIRRDGRPVASKELNRREDIIEAKDITWRVTRRDLL